MHGVSITCGYFRKVWFPNIIYTQHRLKQAPKKQFVKKTPFTFKLAYSSKYTNFVAFTTEGVTYIYVYLRVYLCL